MIIRDIIEPNIKFEMVESSEVDGVHILGKVRGEFFVPGGISRNKRYYSETLWEKVLAKEEVQEMFKNRRMFGTIGHDQALDDTALLEGKVSHIVTNAFIKDGKGIGEALILNTPAGKILNTVLRAGSSLFVSSRGTGSYLEGKSSKHNVPEVDPDTYDLHTWDFVLNPGFLQANPKLAESLEKDINYIFGENTLIEEDKKDMDKSGTAHTAIIENITREKIQLQEDLNKALLANEDLKAKVVVAESESQSYRSQLTRAEDTVRKLESYKSLGDVVKIKADLAMLESIRSTLISLGLMNKGENIIEALKKINTVVESSIAKIEEYKAIGSVDKINKALSGIEEVHSTMKDLDLIDDGETILESLVAISNALDIAGQFIGRTKKRQVEENIKSIAGELKLSEDTVKTLIDKGMSKEEISKLYEGFSKIERIKSQFKKTTPVNENNKSGKEDNKSTSPIRKPLGESLMARFSK